MDKLPTDFFLHETRFTKHVYQDVYPSIDPTKPELSAAGRVVVVSGASRGIGRRGIVDAFAKAGAKAIVLLATKTDKLREVEAEVHAIHPGTETLAAAPDLTNPKAVADLFVTIKSRWGHADVLVNNAAINVGFGDLHTVDPDEWWSNYEIDVRGAFNLMQAFIASLPDPKSSPATIVNLNSKAAYVVIPGMSGYSTAKLATLQLCAHLAAGYPSINIVNVNPGLVDTDSLMPMFQRFDLETPALTGGLCVWLAAHHDQAKFLSGRFVNANWSIDDLVERKEEIEKDGKLRINLVGTFGKEQFGE